MLEYILTRPYDRALVIGPRRGSRSSCSTSCTPTAAARAPTSPCSCAASATPARRTNLRCVGTSATLAGPGTFAEQRAEVAARREPPVRRDGRAGARHRRDAPPGDSRGRRRATRPSSTQLARAGPRRRTAGRPTRRRSPTRSPAGSSARSGSPGTQTDERYAPLRAAAAARARAARPLHSLSDDTGVDASACPAALQAALLRGQPAFDDPTGSRSSPSACTSSSAAAARSRPRWTRAPSGTSRTSGQQYVPGRPRAAC